MDINVIKDIDTAAIKVIEECSELQKELCKVALHGWFGHHPDAPNDYNIERVKKEMEDVMNAVEQLDKHMRQSLHDHHRGSS